MLGFIRQIRTSPREAMGEFVTFVAADAGSQRTAGTYQQRLRGFIEFLEADGVTTIKAVQPGHVDRYVAGLKTQSVRYAHGSSDRPPEAGGLSKATIAGRTQAIKRFGKWCRDRYGLPESFAGHLRVRRPKPRPADKAMRFEELLRLLDHAGQVAQSTKSIAAVRYMAMLSFIVETMARRGEVASVQLSRLNLDSPEVVAVRRGDRVVTLTGYSAEVDGKTGKRTVWFTEWCAAWLRAYLTVRPDPRREPAHDFCWVALSDRHYGLPLSPGGLYQAHREFTEAVEMKGPSGLHAIRHCMATYWAKHTSLDQLQKKLGHASILTTMGYVATDDREVIAATEELTPLRYAGAANIATIEPELGKPS